MKKPVKKPVQKSPPAKKVKKVIDPIFMMPRTDNLFGSHDIYSFNLFAAARSQSMRNGRQKSTLPFDVLPFFDESFSDHSSARSSARSSTRSQASYYEEDEEDEVEQEEDDVDEDEDYSFGDELEEIQQQPSSRRYTQAWEQIDNELAEFESANRLLTTPPKIVSSPPKIKTTVTGRKSRAPAPKSPSRSKSMGTEGMANVTSPLIEPTKAARKSTVFDRLSQPKKTHKN